MRKQEVGEASLAGSDPALHKELPISVWLIRGNPFSRSIHLELVETPKLWIGLPVRAALKPVKSGRWDLGLRLS